MRVINGVPFSKRFLTRLDNRPNRPMSPRYLTIHETGNFDDGATADASTRYMHNGSGGRQASWHVTVDDLEAIQALHWDEQGWHAGDGAGPGNTQSIGMEVCVNLDGARRIKAWDNAARVAAFLVERFGLELRQHNHWSGKNCPHDMRTREYPLSWQDFLAQVQGYREGTPKQEVEMTPEEVKKIVHEQTARERDLVLQCAYAIAGIPRPYEGDAVGEALAKLKPIAAREAPLWDAIQAQNTVLHSVVETLEEMEPGLGLNDMERQQVADAIDALAAVVRGDGEGNQ